MQNMQPNGDTVEVNSVATPSPDVDSISINPDTIP